MPEVRRSAFDSLEHHAAEPRARDIGIPFDGSPGPLNAITDVAGVEVGYKTLISGEGKLVIGRGPVRTGVTAILPPGKGVRTVCSQASLKRCARNPDPDYQYQ
jgi:L-aminopeptidase/D-esterase-like protein